MQLRYSFRLYPTDDQRDALARTFGCARVVYNDAVQARQAAHAQGLPLPSTATLARQLITEAKKTPERAWLNQVSTVALQQSLRDMDVAYRNFFDSLAGRRRGPKVGRPRFKKRNNRQSVRFTNNAGWRITPGRKLHLPKIGPVRVKWSRELPATPSSVTVVKDPAGRYFACFIVQTDKEHLPETDATVGIDLGLAHFAVLSDGTKIESPRFLRRAEKKLRRAQQAVNRKQKGSSNREKAKARAARIHAKIADARRDFHHKLSTKLIRENQAIAVESLAVEAIRRTHLGKSVSDAGWSRFVEMLEYKAAKHGRTLHKIGRFEPTSQVCSACGVKGLHKALDVRIWTCGECHTALDRDINAAVNVAKAAGLAVTACRAQVRPGPLPAPREEAGTHRDGLTTVAGIPAL